MKKIRRRFLPGNWKIKVKRSLAGRGVFAEETIPPGACIIEYKGRKVSEEEMYKDRGKYFFTTGRNSMIDGNIPGNVAKFINHSCAPNCEADIKDKRIYIFAIKTIKKGEELNYDYGDEYFDRHIKPIGCLCTKCIKKRTKK